MTLSAERAPGDPTIAGAWLELSVVADIEAVEIVGEILSRYAPGGTSVEPAIELVDEGLGARVDPSRPAIVRAYLPAIDAAVANARVEGTRQALGHLQAFGLRPIGDLEVRVVHESDWADTWKRYFPVLRVGRRIVIRPTWRRHRREPGEVVLALDPGMAFGTGLHPTTRLCLEGIEAWADAGLLERGAARDERARVLDVGCGSGILGLAAARLGAGEVLGLDTDPIAVDATQANARRNRLVRRIVARRGSVPAGAGGFDLVVANLIPSLLVVLAVPLRDELLSGGRLLASGIFIDRETDVRAEFERVGLSVIGRWSEGDWVALEAERGRRRGQADDACRRRRTGGRAGPARSAPHYNRAPMSLRPDPVSSPDPARVRTAAITNLGCKVNQSEMDAAARLLRGRGVTLVGDRAQADLHLINTCTVTSTADQKSRQAVRRARRTNPAAEIVVTGCSVQVAPEAFVVADPAAHLVDNGSKDRLLAELDALVGLPEAGSGPIEQALPTLSGVEVDGVADERTVVDRTRAFVKVQDGCSFYCTYCIIPRARGHERSLPPEVVLADVRRAISAGHREIVLTGINVGTYDGGSSERGPRGSHRWAALTLAGLLRRILAETAIERIRLSSIEPQHVDDELLDVWTSAPDRCLPHLHLPLQSGDDGVLRRMGRRYDSAAYALIVERARAAIPGLAVHADVIAGFPTEDDAAWERSFRFIRSLDLAGLHAFRYSARAGTPATRMAGQVDDAVKKRRSAELLAVAAACRGAFAARQVGREVAVLFETRLADGRWVGHAGNHVLVAANALGVGSLQNAIGHVRVSGVDPDAADRAVGLVIVLDRPKRRPLDVLEVIGSGARSQPVPAGVPIGYWRG